MGKERVRVRAHPSLLAPDLDIRPWWRREVYDERAMLLVVGRRGSGKTLFAVKLAVQRMRAGFPVYANFEILDVFTGLRAGRIEDWEQVYDLNGATVIIDEANSWIPSRKWDATPMKALKKFAESRKDSCELVFTAQHEERVDKVVRELADWIVICNRSPLPKKIPLYRYTWTYLETIGIVREAGGTDAPIRSDEVKRTWGWIPPHVYESYNTTEGVKLGFGEGRVVEPRREPSILWADGLETEWDPVEALYRGRGAGVPHPFRILHFRQHGKKFVLDPENEKLPLIPEGELSASDL